MLRVRSLLLFVVFAAACEGCPDGTDVSELSASFSVEPAAIAVSPLWAGHPRTVTLTVESHGAAPILGLTASLHDVDGPFDVTATLDGDALAPGARMPLEVVLSAPPGSAGPASATVVIDAGSDGQVLVPLTASVVQPPSCDDANPCTSDRFDPDEGRCLHSLLADGASCSDGSACTTGDACLAGRCLGEVLRCDDGVECTVDRCDPEVGCRYEPMPARCHDDDPCTNDVCEAFRGCSNPPLDEGALCHFDGCNEIGLCFLGQCVLSEVPDGMPCEDGDACTRDDTCQAGECVAGDAVGVGAAPPVIVDVDGISLELCRGPGTGLDCYGIVDEPGLERVLAVDRRDGRARLVWQGGYRDSSGALCDPTDPLYAPLALDPPEYDAGQAGARPASFVCAAGVYLTTLPLGLGAGPPSTRQLTSVRGPAAAAFLLNEDTWGTAEAPAEPPPPPLPPPAAVVIAHPDFARAGVWIEERDEHGDNTTPAVRRMPTSDVGVLAGLAVGADEQRIVVAAHAGTVLHPYDLCDAEGCDVIPASLWTFAQPRAFGDGGFDTVVRLPREIDAACADIEPGAVIPLEVHDLTVALHEHTPRVSLRMSRSVCGDVAPGTHGAPPDAPRPWRMAAWSFELGDWLLLDPSVPVVDPLFSYADGSEPLASFRTTPEGAAVALRHVPAPCTSCGGCSCDDDGGGDDDSPCMPPLPQTCFDTVIERTADVEATSADALVRSEGVALSGQTVPLVVEGELGVVTLVGDRVELLGRGEGGALSRLVAPAPPQYLWDQSSPLLPGPPESHLVVGRGLPLHIQAIGVPPRGSALVQVFGCGFGSATVDGACLEPEDCAEGLVCDRTVCLPGPDCETSGTCDLCWGRCLEPPDPDDGGFPDDDAGDAEDAGDAGDAGAPEDAGDPADGGPSAG